MRTPSSEEVKQSNNFPFQALFHECRSRSIPNDFQTVTIEVIKTSVDMLCLQHKATQLKFACNNFLQQCVPTNFISKDMRNVLLFQELSHTMCNIWC